MRAEQAASAQRFLEGYTRLINKAFEPLKVVSQDTLGDAQKSQLFMDAVDRALRQLPLRGSQILNIRFGLPDGKAHTLVEIALVTPRLDGEGTSVTSERVRQIEERSLRKMRQPRRSAGIKEFLADVSPTEEIEPSSSL